MPGASTGSKDDRAIASTVALTDHMEPVLVRATARVFDPGARSASVGVASRPKRVAVSGPISVRSDSLPVEVALAARVQGVAGFAVVDCVHPEAKPRAVSSATYSVAPAGVVALATDGVTVDVVGMAFRHDAVPVFVAIPEGDDRVPGPSRVAAGD
jgi:hypothetical protein